MRMDEPKSEPPLYEEESYREGYSQHTGHAHSKRKRHHRTHRRYGHPLIASVSILCIIIDIALIAQVVLRHAPVENILPAFTLTLAVVAFLSFTNRRK